MSDWPISDALAKLDKCEDRLGCWRMMAFYFSTLFFHGLIPESMPGTRIFLLLLATIQAVAWLWREIRFFRTYGELA